MGEHQQGGYIPRKGKPSGNGHESEGVNEPFAGTGPETENEIRAEYIDDETGEPAENVKVQHHNRHLHKGEELATFKDRDNDDEP